VQRQQKELKRNEPPHGGLGGRVNAHEQRSWVRYMNNDIFDEDYDTRLNYNGT